MKKLFLLFIMLAAAATAAAQQPSPSMAGDVLPGKIELREDFTIVVDGNIVVTPDVPPVEKDGIIFVSLRYVGEALGAKVSWDAGAKTVALDFSGSKIEFIVGNGKAMRNGEEIAVDAPPFIYENRAMVPLKFSASAAGFKVAENENTMAIESPQPAEKAGAVEAKQEKPKSGLETSASSLDEIRTKAQHDPITKKLKWLVIPAWLLAGALWIIRLIGAMKSDDPDRFKDKILIFFVLAVGVPCILIFMLSTYWAAMVAIITSIVGLVSTEEYGEKMVTMANAAQGAGLICTLFGLGLLIGPAIASRDIHAIGFGIYVKIEPTITGLALSIIMSMLVSYDARKHRQ